MTKSNALIIRRDDTLIATQKASNGYWAVLELPARSSVIHTSSRLFRTEKLAETHMSEQYSDAEWSSAEEIAKESNDRYEQEKKVATYVHELFYPQDEFQVAYNAILWIGQNCTCLGEIMGPMEDSFETNPYEFYNIRFMTRGKLSEQEEQALLLATKPSTCMLNGED